MMPKHFPGIILISLLTFSGLSYSQLVPPSNIKVKLVDGNIVKLSWDAQSSNQKVSYNIYRAEENNSSTSIASPKPEFKKLNSVTAPVYEDKTEASPGKVFIYYVTTVNSNGVESASSNYVNVKIGETGTDQNIYTY